MASSRPVPIPTPLSRRWETFRFRVLPVMLWLAAAGLVIALWHDNVTVVDAVGRVEARQWNVASSVAGTVASLTVDLFDEVREQQCVVRLDDQPIRAQLAIADATLEQLKAKLRATEAQLQVDEAMRRQGIFEDARTYAVRIEQIRRDKLAYLVTLQYDEMDLQRLGVTLERYKAMVGRDVITQQAYDDIKYQHAALEGKVAATKAAIATLDKQLKAAVDRQEAPPLGISKDNIEVSLSPIREEITVQAKRIDDLIQQRGKLVLTAQVNGKVCAVYRRVGETVAAFDPILAIAEAHSTRVVSFVEETTRLRPYVGMPVEIRRQTSPVQMGRSKIIKVGAQVEQFPTRYLLNANVLRWGQRVLIDMPQEMLAPVRRTAAGQSDTSEGKVMPEGDDASPAFAPPLPGELVNVRYFASESRLRWLR
jgi:multidrug resistance efflux pump